MIDTWYAEVARSARARELPDPTEEIAHSLTQWRQVSGFFKTLFQENHCDCHVHDEDDR